MWIERAFTSSTSINLVKIARKKFKRTENEIGFFIIKS